jgi:TolB-like protein
MLLALLLAAAAVPGHVAVLEFQNAVPGVDRAALSQRVREEIPRLKPGASVMTRDQMLQLANANPQALDQCDDRSCVEVGRLLGADTVVDGRVVKIGANLRLTLKLVETRGGKVLAQSVAAGKTYEELLAAIQKAVKQLLKRA